jgi:uncharacterized protein
MPTILLKPGDEARVDRFLRSHADSSLFLRSNLRAAGLTYEGKRLQGTWVGQEEQGDLVGVVCHLWNGNLLFQAPHHAVALAHFASEQSKRKVEGLVGPWEQLESARRALNLDVTRPKISSLESLYALPLSSLIVPSGGWECRRMRAEDLDVTAQYRSEFIVEALGGEATDAREAVAASAYFVLCVEGRIVSSGCFNAQLPECVQLGGIYTPPAERRRGYARRLVAGMLRVARAEGVTRAVLFFRRIGDYGLVLWTVK